MSKREKRFIQNLSQFLNKHPDYLLEFNYEGFYNNSNGKGNSDIKVVFTPLVAECLVEIVRTSRGSLNVLVDSSYLGKLEDRGLSQLDFDSLMGLFFFHELHHLRQRVGMKHTIVGYRKMGFEGELIVARLDIIADRIAVRDAAAFLEGQTTRGRLSELQSISLDDFPSLKGHSVEGVWRKNRRFVACRLHYIAEKEELFSDELSDPNSFLLAMWVGDATKADFSEFYLMMDGSVLRHEGVAKIDREEIQFLDQITRSTIPTADKMKELDQFLYAVLDKLHFGISKAA